jgi:hypothetical protein
MEIAGLVNKKKATKSKVFVASAAKTSKIPLLAWHSRALLFNDGAGSVFSDYL